MIGEDAALIARTLLLIGEDLGLYRANGRPFQTFTMSAKPPVLAHLEPDACFELLRLEEVGRLAISVAGHPDIFPINYAVDDDTIVFCTAEGTKLAGSFVSPSIAFEADGYDAATGDAWSVVVKGRAEEIEMHDLLDESAFPLYPWSATTKSRFVRVVPEEISGRRFHVVRRRPS